MYKYIIKFFEENGVFICDEIIIENETMLRGRFEKYPYKQKKDFHQFFKDDQSVLIKN